MSDITHNSPIVLSPPATETKPPPHPLHLKRSSLRQPLNQYAEDHDGVIHCGGPPVRAFGLDHVPQQVPALAELWFQNMPEPPSIDKKRLPIQIDRPYTVQSLGSTTSALQRGSISGKMALAWLPFMETLIYRFATVWSWICRQVTRAPSIPPSVEGINWV